MDSMQLTHLVVRIFALVPPPHASTQFKRSNKTT